MYRFVASLLFFASLACNGVVKSGKPRTPRCEPITTTMCPTRLYNMTILPNLPGETTQQQAVAAMERYYPLVGGGCGQQFRWLLCTWYLPVCTVLEDPIPPCETLCLIAKQRCEPIMNNFGFSWSDLGIDCAKLPPSGLCVNKLDAAQMKKMGQSSEPQHKPSPEPQPTTTPRPPAYRRGGLLNLKTYADTRINQAVRTLKNLRKSIDDKIRKLMKE
ncbi:protein mom-5-like [Tubulanus polymorphus]|uniref:protein mom-5-like n=1 Tax=Tubulanus polymorphus TaxID=672921 RepID=UPI003DA24899